MDPIKYDGDFAVFSSRQVDLYGEPEGYEKYYVVQEWVELGMDWKFEQERVWRKVHRYSRLERFKNILLELAGIKLVPKQVVDTVKYWGIDERPRKSWNSVRFILKAYGWKKHYNKIPSILKIMGFGYDEISSLQIQTILLRFRQMSSNFDFKKRVLKRVYFPDLRYIALRLMQEEGVNSSFEFVFLKTKSKLKDYENMFRLLTGNHH